MPQQSCFCQCTGATCNYWSYWQLRTDGWQYSNLGASGSEIKPGQVDGWAWGAGSTDSTSGKPPALTFADLCAASTPTATPTAAPATATPPSTSTPTPTPTITPTPFPTAVPLGNPPRIETFTADATQLAPGEVATLHWRVVDAASVMLVAGGQRVPVDAEGTTTLAPPGDVEVRLEASNNSGTAAGSVQLQVIQPQAAPGPVRTPTPFARTYGADLSGARSGHTSSRSSIGTTHDAAYERSAPSPAGASIDCTLAAAPRAA